MKSPRMFNYFYFILFVGGMLLMTACSSDETSAIDSGAVPITPTEPPPEPLPEPSPEPLPAPPPEPTVTAPVNLVGLWEGTLTSDTVTLEVVMAFHMSEGATEGRTMAVAFQQSTGQPYILIDSGYQDVTNDNWGFEYVIGRLGAQGTSLKSFLFENNLISNLSGGFELDLNDNTLTGTANFDALGAFVVELHYSLQNLKEATLNDLIGTWVDTDPENGWDDTATDTTLMIAADGAMSASATGSSCIGSGLVSDVTNYNIYLVNGPDINKPVVTLSGCSTRTWTGGTADVDGFYDGMGVLLEDDSGSELLVVLMTETLNDPPSMATYNAFIKN